MPVSASYTYADTVSVSKTLHFRSYRLIRRALFKEHLVLVLQFSEFAVISFSEFTKCCGGEMQIVRVATQPVRRNEPDHGICIGNSAQCFVDARVVLGNMRLLIIGKIITKTSHQERNVIQPKFFAESTQYNGEFFLITRISVRGTFRFPLVPQNGSNSRGSRRKLCHIAGVVKKKTANLPVIEGGSTVRAGNNSYVCVMIPCIQIRKAFHKTDSRKFSVRVDGNVHRAPATVSENADSTVHDGRYFILEATPRCIGLSDQ